MTPNGINTSVLWNFGDSTTGVGLPVNHQFSTSGIYVICATEIDIITQNVISSCCYSLNAIGTSTTCAFAALSPNGTDFTFTSNASSTAIVTWDFGDGTIGTGLATAHTYFISGVYNICMTTSDFLSTCTTCQTITVNVGPSPCSISMAYDSTNMNTVFFYYTPIGGAGNTITWTFGDGVTASGGTSQQHTYASAGVYTAIAVEYDSTGTMVCQAGIGVQVGPPTNCAFTVIPSMGALNTFFFNTSYDTTLYVAVWDFGDGISYTGGQSETHTYPSGPGTYFVCLNIVDQITQNIACTYCQAITIPGTTPCAANFTTVPYGLDAYFIDYSSADPAVTTYTWDFGDGSPLNTSRFPVHTYGIPGTYNVCLSILNSTCADTICQTIVVDSTIIAPVLCTAYFIFTQLSPYQLAVVNLSSGTNLSFAWDFGDGNTSTAAYPIHNYNTYGTFQICLTVTDPNGCSNTYCDSLTVDSTGMIIYRSTNVGFTINVVSPSQLNTVSVDENLSLISSIYPNPSKDRIVVTSSPKSGVAIYSILSVSGQKIEEGKLSGESSEINTSGLASGIYFLEVKTKSGEKSFVRFIKE